MNNSMKQSDCKCCFQLHSFVLLFSFLILSVFFVFSASNSTSPWYPTAPVFDLEKADQATFTLMGKHWFEDGLLPYTDLFDHKGPMIFLINGLGWSITSNVHGIAFIQIVFIWLYTLLAYCTLREKHRKSFSYMGVIISLVLLRLVYGGGNTVEEYGLPFQMLCMLGLYRWSNQSDVHHTPFWAFIYGLSIAFFILNRATDALCICAGCLVIFICLIHAKAYRNILENILAGLAGIVLPILPFIVYFAHHNALDALWYGMIGYNIEYASDEISFWLAQTDFKMLVEMCIYCIPIWASIFCGILAWILGHKRKASLWILSGLCAIAFLYKSRFYDHYVINYVPFAIIALAELDLAALKHKCRPLHYGTLFIYASLLFPALVLCARMQWNIRNDYKWQAESPVRPYDALIQAIPESERDSVILYNSWASIYLKYDITPAYTYFALQDWQGGQSTHLMSMIEDEFATCEAKWVLTHGGSSVNIKHILDTHYEVVMENENYRLHRLLSNKM